MCPLLDFLDVGLDAGHSFSGDRRRSPLQALLADKHRARGGDVPYMADFGAGWHTHFTHLIALLEGAPRPPFWPLHAKLKADYEKLRIAAQQG